MLDYIKLAQQAMTLDKMGKYESADAILLRMAQANDDDAPTGSLNLDDLTALQTKIKAWTLYAQDPINNPIPSKDFGIPGYNSNTGTSTTPAQVLTRAYQSMYADLTNLTTSGQFTSLPAFKDTAHALAYFANQTKPENIGKAIPVKKPVPKPVPGTSVPQNGQQNGQQPVNQTAAPAGQIAPTGQAQPQATQANLPLGGNQAQPGQGSATLTNGSPAPGAQQAPVAKTAPSWFELAHINPSAYQGSARDNEALRAVIDPKARTFYNAYVNKFHTWDAHPSQRIEKLSQPSAVAAPQTKQQATPAPQNQQMNQQAFQQTNSGMV